MSVDGIDDYMSSTGGNIAGDIVTSTISSAEEELITTTLTSDGSEIIVPLLNTTLAPSNNFTWHIGTMTPPPTVIITSSAGYYYLYSFYCFMCLLFLMSLVSIVVRLSIHNKKAVQNTRRQRNLATVNYSAGTSSGNNCNAAPNVAATTSRAAQSNATFGHDDGDYDLPPQYDDIWNILDAKMDLNAAEEGAVGGLASAISTTTMETVVDVGPPTVPTHNMNANYPVV